MKTPVTRGVTCGNRGEIGYTELGKIGDFLPFEQQRHELFAVTDFKLADFDIELGLGYGLTSGSDRLIAKAIIGYDFPVPGSTKSNGTGLKPPLMIKARPQQSGLDALNPVFAFAQ